jgi:hypothetical protein
VLVFLLPVCSTSINQLKSCLESINKIRYNVLILVSDCNLTEDREKLYTQYTNIKVVSKSDSGIYEGVNKLIGYIPENSFVSFINSDDFVNNKYFEKAIKILEKNKDIQGIYGDINFGGKIINPRINRYSFKFLKYQVMPFPHISLVLRSIHYFNSGGFKEDFSISSDLFFLNNLISSKVELKYLKLISGYCNPGGISSTGEHLEESYRCALDYKKPKALSFLILIFLKLKYKINNIFS